MYIIPNKDYIIFEENKCELKTMNGFDRLYVFNDKLDMNAVLLLWKLTNCNKHIMVSKVPNLLNEMRNIIHKRGT